MTYASADEEMPDQGLDLAPRLLVVLVDRLTGQQRVLGLDVVAGQRRQVGVEQVDDVDLHVRVMRREAVEKHLRDLERVGLLTARRCDDVQDLHGFLNSRLNEAPALPAPWVRQLDWHSEDGCAIPTPRRR